MKKKPIGGAQAPDGLWLCERAGVTRGQKICRGTAHLPWRAVPGCRAPTQAADLSARAGRATAAIISRLEAAHEVIQPRQVAGEQTGALPPGADEKRAPLGFRTGQGCLAKGRRQ